MFPRRPCRVITHLDVLPFVAPPNRGHLDWLSCPHCDASLSLSQPDPMRPTTVVGSCARCDRLYLIFLSTDATTGIVVALPGSESMGFTPGDVDAPPVSTPIPEALLPWIRTVERAPPRPGRVEFAVHMMRRLWARHWPTEVPGRDRRQREALSRLRSWLAAKRPRRD